MSARDMTLSTTTVPPANAGFPLEEAPLPYWLDRPCPAWCMMTVPHQDNEDYADRLHMSVSHEIVLTLQHQPAGEPGAGGPAYVNAGMWQHYRERDPHITVIVNGERDIDFTLDEALDLAGMLAAAALAGKSGETKGPGSGLPYWQDRPCPAWCTEQHADTDAPPDRIHVGGYRMLALTMEDPALSVLEGEAGAPQCIGVRLEQAWREYEARVCIVFRDEYLDLTLAESGELTEALASLVLQAERPGWPNAADSAR